MADSGSAEARGFRRRRTLRVRAGLPAERRVRQWQVRVRRGLVGQRQLLDAGLPPRQDEQWLWPPQAGAPPGIVGLELGCGGRPGPAHKELDHGRLRLRPELRPVGLPAEPAVRHRRLHHWTRRAVHQEPHDDRPVLRGLVDRPRPTLRALAVPARWQRRGRLRINTPTEDRAGEPLLELPRERRRHAYQRPDTVHASEPLHADDRVPANPGADDAALNSTHGGAGPALVSVTTDPLGAWEYAPRVKCGSNNEPFISSNGTLYVMSPEGGPQQTAGAKARCNGNMAFMGMWRAGSLEKAISGGGEHMPTRYALAGSDPKASKPRRICASIGRIKRSG